MATITYKNASCIYEGSDKLAVDSLNLDIQDGEFVVLVGPSGSGKSTALRMLAGLEDIDEGSIEIGGKDMTGVPSKDRDIAMVFQNYALYPNKTVAENMGFALKLRGVSADERRKKVEDAAKILDLTEFLDRKPAKLSGGQRQRVAMGRAIVREPQVFCMDEPLSNLDAKLRVQTRTQIAALQRRLGTTTVYVTHDQVEAMTMGDRVAVLRFGKLQQFASPNELYDKPANAFVAGFIGSPAMNLVTLPITADGVKIGDSTLELERDDILPSWRDAGLSEVTFGIRPEQLELTDSGGVEVVVDLVEDLGSEAYVYTHAGSGVRVGGAVQSAHGAQAGRHGAVAQASRRGGSPVQPGHGRAHQLTAMRAPEFRLRAPTPGLARVAMGPTVVGVERPRRSVARHRRGAQPPPGEVRRGRRSPVGGQGHACADRRQGVRRSAQARGNGSSRGASCRPGAATRVRHRDPGHPLPRGVLAVPPPVHAAAARPTEAPGAALGRDGRPAGGTAPPRCLLG